ncbi:hypothetical protein [Maridesulfovibrio sp.]|uniref:hypothetical protein n=1 Tax=Maridesulfovibrio sp. TaxID=2795000 RepID=UPI0029F4DD9F|nr:hypothetical protein [Maridesulfovibrio sp.]
MSPALIMFAIQAAIKIGKSAGKAYITATRDRALLLPPPRTIGQTVSDADLFFDEEAETFLSPESEKVHPKAERINELRQTLSRNGNLDNKEASEFKQYHLQCQAILDLDDPEYQYNRGPWGEKIHIEAKELNALVTIDTYSWEGRKAPKWWLSFGETVFDVALQYARTDHRVCDLNTTQGQALNTFLRSIEDLELTELDLQDFPAKMLVTVLDVASAHPGIITGGARGQKLIGATTLALSKEIDTKLNDCCGTDRGSVKEWGNIIFRSILLSAGNIAIEDPAAYLGINGPKSEKMASAVGKAILDVVFVEGEIQFRELFDGPGLEAVTHAALGVVAKHPDILLDTENKGLSNLVTAMAQDLAATETIYAKEALPEILRLLLDNTADNLELFWQDQTDPHSHLLIVAASHILKTLADDSTGQWQLQFTHADAIQVLDCIFKELKANPAWLTNGDETFKAALETILDETLSILRAKGDPQMSRAAAINIISIVAASTLSRAEFIEDVSYKGSIKPFITACLDVIVSSAFANDGANEKEIFMIKCQLMRDDGLDLILKVVLDLLQKSKLGSPEDKMILLNKLEHGITALVQDIKSGKGVNISSLESTMMN